MSHSSLLASATASSFVDKRCFAAGAGRPGQRAIKRRWQRPATKHAARKLVNVASPRRTSCANTILAALAALPGALWPWRRRQVATQRWPYLLLIAACAVLALVKVHEQHERARFMATHPVMVRMDPPLRRPRWPEVDPAPDQPLIFETKYTAVS